MKDANVSAAGDHVVLMGAASKGIIQRGYQHNATVYKAPYAKNPFDSVTDDELNEYKKTVEKKRHGDGKLPVAGCNDAHYLLSSLSLSLFLSPNCATGNDTDFSESEALSSLQISGPGAKGESIVSPPSQSEQEDAAAGMWMATNILNCPDFVPCLFLTICSIFSFCRASRPKNRNETSP